MKTYYEFMKEISAEELYDKFIQYGMFSEKLPPIFSAKSFLEYCKNKREYDFADKWYKYITYDNMRNINIPRNIGIPTPMGHEKLCKSLSNHWNKITDYFKDKTQHQSRIISRIHIRKMIKTDALFEMNYKNWRIDGTPEPDIYIGKKYMVKADISQCYASIYTHAIPWALVGKSDAKMNNDIKLWYNEIDYYAQRSKNGETHGILIGPHTSNILSEIVLCAVDEQLVGKYDSYIRNIDDYTCYVDTMEEAEKFLLDLNRELREYGLSLNHKKTEINELPLSVTKIWINRIEDKVSIFKKNNALLDYIDIRGYMDFIIQLVHENSDNQSIMYYAIKSISEYKLSNNAKEYFVKTMISLSLLYPYLVPLLDKWVFKVHNTNNTEIGKYADMIYKKYIAKNNYEACSYALMYAVNAGTRMDNIDIDETIKTNDCILMLLTYIYCVKTRWNSGAKQLKRYACVLEQNGDIEQYWLFVYECLGHTQLKNDWSAMKKAGVSFLKEEYR